jgi:hypothetical protein
LPAGRAPPRGGRALLERRHPALTGADLADDARAHAGAVEAVADLVDELRGDVVHGPAREVVARGIERLDIPAAADG